MFKHLPKGQGERVLPQVSHGVLKMLETERVLRLMKGLTYQTYCLFLKRMWGFAPHWRIKRAMYRNYRVYHGMPPDKNIGG